MAEIDTLFDPFPQTENPPDPWPQKPPKLVFGDEKISVQRRLNKEILPYVIFPDESDPECADIYQSAAVQYLPDVYFAFPTLYYHYPHPPEGFINDGVHDLQFASSRDGVNWNRRGPYVNLDLPDGLCTKRMHMLNGIVPQGHVMSQYYVGGNRTHGQDRLPDKPKPKSSPKPGDAIFHRIEQRLDGFVSLDSAYTGGTLTTKPFTLESEQLRLNIDTSASGVAYAALLDENGKAIPGYGIEECDRIQGNDTQYVVSWNKSSDLSELKGETVKLLLESRHTKLFALYHDE